MLIRYLLRLIAKYSQFPFRTLWYLLHFDRSLRAGNHERVAQLTHCTRVRRSPALSLGIALITMSVERRGLLAAGFVAALIAPLLVLSKLLGLAFGLAYGVTAP